MSDQSFLPVSQLLGEERLLVAARVERKLLKQRGLPDPDRLPLRRYRRPIEVIVGISLGFTTSVFALLFVFVLVNMILHVSF